ncbi:unnamed protein product, partial [Prunus brigantina]
LRLYSRFLISPSRRAIVVSESFAVIGDKLGARLDCDGER